MDWEAFFGNYRKPDFVPGFTILNKLGSGVFGEVYKAKRTSIGKLYAIKFLRLQDERLHEQVVRELDSVDHFAQVDHPNLVSIEDRGEVCGIPYIIMGYAGDATLKSLLQDGPMTIDRAGPLFRQVIRGVKALHDHSIIHFDLKPANIFIKGEVARVGDYGLSKLMTESRATLSMGRGTPYYMAPEMLQRRGDARSDVYSLGVILYEMLVGEVPFKGETEWEILKRHETEMPAIPDTIPPQIRAFLKQCLGKDPESRFVNAGAMLNAFEASIAGQGPAFVAPTATGLPPIPPPPVPADAGHGSVRAGAAMGRLAAKGKVTIERVRKELQDVLENVRSKTGEAYAAAKQSFEYETAQGQARQPLEELSARQERKARREARRAVRQSRREERRARRQAARAAASADPEHRPSRKRRAVGASARGLGHLLILPITLLGWVFRNALQVVVVAAIIVAICAVIHLGLEEMIL